MAEFRRPSHVRVGRLLERMDGEFLERAKCYFGGGTALALAHGEYRESRDIDFLVSSRSGIRMIRETVAPGSLGKIFREPVMLVREVVSDRDAVRTYVTDDPSAAPVKLEIVYEARIELEGAMAAALGVPVLGAAHAVAEKLLANADRGTDGFFHSRDVIDLAFVSLDLDEDALNEGLALAQAAYGETVLKSLNEALRKLEIDAKYRAQCLDQLLIEPSAAKRLREGLAKLRALKRGVASASARSRTRMKLS